MSYNDKKNMPNTFEVVMFPSRFKFCFAFCVLGSIVMRIASGMKGWNQAPMSHKTI